MQCNATYALFFEPNMYRQITVETLFHSNYLLRLLHAFVLVSQITVLESISYSQPTQPTIQSPACTLKTQIFVEYEYEYNKLSSIYEYDYKVLSSHFFFVFPTPP